MLNINNYNFTGYTTRTRYNTTEHGAIYKNGVKIASGRDVWSNRPWYCYQYQKALINGLVIEIEERKERIKANYKKDNNINRITKKHAEILKGLIDSDLIIKEYRELKSYLNETRPAILEG